MSTSASVSTGGPGFLSLLTLVFVTLKLTDVIDWSWWWVTAPLWGVLALILVGVIIACLIGCIWVAYKTWSDK